MDSVQHIASTADTETLYRRHCQRVLRYCLACLRRTADAEDALQQTFLQAHRALARGEQPVAEASWLLAIARNVCLTRADAQRRRSRRETAEDPHVLEEVASTADAREGIRGDVCEAFACLSDRQRQALFLREWHGSSYAEIAAALGTTTSAVETLIFRARRALADELRSHRSRRPQLVAAAQSLRAWLCPTAAKVTVAAATTAVAAGTAVTLHVRHTPPRATQAVTHGVSAVQPPAVESPIRVVARRSHAKPSAHQPEGARVHATASSAAPTDAGNAWQASVATGVQDPAATTPTDRVDRVDAAPAPTVSVPASTGAVAASDGGQPAGDAVTAPAQQGSGVAGQTADGGAQVVAGAVSAATQTVGDIVQAATTATAPVSQTVAGAVSAATQTVGDVVQVATTASAPASQTLASAAQTASTTVDQGTAAANDATSTVASTLNALLHHP